MTESTNIKLTCNSHGTNMVAMYPKEMEQIMAWYDTHKDCEYEKGLAETNKCETCSYPTMGSLTLETPMV